MKKAPGERLTVHSTLESTSIVKYCPLGAENTVSSISSAGLTSFSGSLPKHPAMLVEMSKQTSNIASPLALMVSRRVSESKDILMVILFLFRQPYRESEMP